MSGVTMDGAVPPGPGFSTGPDEASSGDRARPFPRNRCCRSRKARTSRSVEAAAASMSRVTMDGAVPPGSRFSSGSAAADFSDRAGFFRRDRCFQSRRDRVSHSVEAAAATISGVTIDGAASRGSACGSEGDALGSGDCAGSSRDRCFRSRKARVSRSREAAAAAISGVMMEEAVPPGPGLATAAGATGAGDRAGPS